MHMSVHAEIDISLWFDKAAKQMQSSSAQVAVEKAEHDLTVFALLWMVIHAADVLSAGFRWATPWPLNP